ncbi:MAG: hypothetical protein LIO65_07520 [Odoribacter sp.]|nr:hypothetical protein [Odoribacter sp.]
MDNYIKNLTLNTYSFDLLKEEYKDFLKDDLRLQLEFLEEDKKEQSTLTFVYNSLPERFYLKYPELVNFEYLRKNYLLEYHPYKKKKEDKMSLKESQTFLKRYVQITENYKKVRYIIPDDLFRNVVEGILALCRMKIISLQEQKLLKIELEKFLKDLDELCKKQTEEDTYEIYVFHSLYATKMILKEEVENTKALVYICNSDPIMAANEAFAKRIKKWVNKVLKVSQHINISNELDRIKFISRQREELEWL